MNEAASHSDVDRAIVAATQEGLPLVERPFDEVAKRTGYPPAVVMERIRAMQDAGGFEPSQPLQQLRRADADFGGGCCERLVTDRQSVLQPVDDAAVDRVELLLHAASPRAAKRAPRWVKQRRLNRTSWGKSASPQLAMARRMRWRTASSSRPCTMAKRL